MWLRGKEGKNWNVAVPLRSTIFRNVTVAKSAQRNSLQEIHGSGFTWQYLINYLLSIMFAFPWDMIFLVVSPSFHQEVSPNYLNIEYFNYFRFQKILVCKYFVAFHNRMCVIDSSILLQLSCVPILSPSQCTWRGGGGGVEGKRGNINYPTNVRLDQHLS